MEKDELIHRLAELSFRVEHQDAQLREMARAFSDLGKLFLRYSVIWCFFFFFKWDIENVLQTFYDSFIMFSISTRG